MLLINCSTYSILGVSIFAVLFIALLIIGIRVISRNMRPLFALLNWMEHYIPGSKNGNIPSDTDVLEFKRLATVAQQAVDRFEHQYEERKMFIGNVSHELQTPLAVCSNRLEILLDRPDLNEEMAGELIKLQRSLRHLIKLNKTLLLLSRIENKQYPDKKIIDIGALLSETINENNEIWSFKNIVAKIEKKGEFTASINEQMASVLVGNLVKNAYVHSTEGSSIEIKIDSTGFCISNPGESPLDDTKIFHRFYQPNGRREGSTGLGLALAYSVCNNNNLTISYSFTNNHHTFTVSKQ